MRKILNALWAVVAHAVLLVAAHSTAEHVGHQLIELVRDEWMLTGVERLFASSE